MTNRHRWIGSVLIVWVCASCAGDGWTWQSFEVSPVVGLSVVQAGWDEGRFAGSSEDGRQRWAWALDIVNTSEQGWIGVIEAVWVLEGKEGVVAADTLIGLYAIGPGARTTLMSRGLMPRDGPPRMLSPRLDLWLGMGCSPGSTSRDSNGCLEIGRLSLSMGS
jgi:hypothetical protein